MSSMVEDTATVVIDNRVVTLTGSEGGDEITLPFKAAIHSMLLRNTLFGDHDVDDDDAEPLEMPTEAIKLGRVCNHTLHKVVEFLKHLEKEPFKNIPHPLPHDTFEENVDGVWYQKFFDDENMPSPLVFDMMRAANYMDIKPLLDLTCLKVTFMLNGRSEQEIRDILNLPAMTAEEEARARIEHPWIWEEENNN